MTSVYTHIVLRPFQAGTREVEVGQPVDASEWKNTERLVTTKYLRPMNEADYARVRKMKHVPQGRPLPGAKPDGAKRFIRKQVR